MSRQSELAALGRVSDTGALSNRNILINGAMKVAQRGTSSSSNGYVSLDRWYVNQSGGSTTFSQETNSNPSETSGLQKYARLNVSTSSDFTSIRQPIEDVTSVPEGTATISFWAKGTAPTGGVYTWGTQNFGSGGSSEVDVAPVQVTPTLTSSWVRYSSQITISSIDGKTIGTGSYFLINIGQFSNTGTTAYDLNITGIQLEVGDTATEFEHRSYGDELAKCKRYYQSIDFSGSHLALVIRAGEDNSGLPYNYFELPVTMRSAPSMSTSGTFLDGAQYSDTPTGYELTNTAVTLRGNNGNISAGSSQFVRGGAVLLEAEL